MSRTRPRAPRQARERGATPRSLRFFEGALYSAAIYGLGLVAYAAAHKQFLSLAAEVVLTVVLLLPAVGCLYVIFSVVYARDRARKVGLAGGALLAALHALSPLAGA